VTGFSRTWYRQPIQQELDWLIEDYIREEVLYREALAMGLDKDDTIVRRRMRQKLEFLTEDTTAAAAPTDQYLQNWLDKHPDNFASSRKWLFRRCTSTPAVAAKTHPRRRRKLSRSSTVPGKGLLRYNSVTRRCCLTRFRFPASHRFTHFRERP
jgi:hypothetical protein